MNNMLTVAEKSDHLHNQVSFAEREAELKKQEQLEKEAEQREKNSPYKRWTQFNNDHTDEMISLAIKHPKAHAVLYFLVDQMDQYNAVVCSMQVLTEVLGCSRQTISSAIKCLKDMGFIEVYKSGTGNVYAVNDSVWWKSWGNNRRYSKFPANVVLAESEQNLPKVKAEKMRVVKVKKDKASNYQSE